MACIGHRVPRRMVKCYGGPHQAHWEKIAHMLRHNKKTKLDEDGAATFDDICAECGLLSNPYLVEVALCPLAGDKPRFEAEVWRDGSDEDPIEQINFTHADRDVRLIKVRAIGGHSISGIQPKAVGARVLAHSSAPASIIHGTRIGYLSSIIRSGILAGGRSGQRNDVHMSNMDPLFFPDKVCTKELPGFRSTSRMLILVSPKKLMLSDDLYETRAGAYVFPDDVPDSAIQCAVRLPERTVAFWGKAWRTMDCDLAYALYNQELSKFIKNHFGFATNDGAKITESKREVPDRTIDMGKKEADDNDDEPRQAPPTKAEYEKDNPNPSYTEGEGQPSAKVWKPCNNCGAETWKSKIFVFHVVQTSIHLKKKGTCEMLVRS